MNHQKLNANGKELFFDLDSRRTACKDCGEMIRFAQDSAGKYYPISMYGFTYKIHSCKKVENTKLEKSIYQEEANQEYLNSL